MAGWSRAAGENCGLDCSRNPQKKRVCSLDAALPMLGDGKPVDLVKLYMVVREKGGFNVVSDNGLWGNVAEECGLASEISPFVKLVYVKYLDKIEKGLEEIEAKDSITDLNCRTSILRNIELAAELKELLEMHKWAPLNMNTDMELNEFGNCTVDDEESVNMATANAAVGSDEDEKLNCNLPKSTVADSFSDGYKNPSVCKENPPSRFTDVKMSNEGKSVVVDMEKSNGCVNDEGTDEIDIDSFEASVRKRKRESVSRIVNWIAGVAKGPCNNVVGSLPECSKWKSYGNQETWKQVLLIREALFQKMTSDSGSEQTTHKNNGKMHPSMYDQTGSAYNFRDRIKANKKLLQQEKTPSKPSARSQLSSSKTRTESGSYINGISDSDSSTEESLLDIPPDKIIPLGPDFQAEIPEWKGPDSQSDSKWFGCQNWPLKKKVDNRFIVEREPIGKGRQESCGCEVPKSIACVRFHIAERRLRVKRELGMAFHHWGFGKMGEDAKLGWQPEEEKKFKKIVHSNPSSLDKCFWDEIVKYFKTKKRDELVSYFFNVFLLQRRAHQNRVTPNSVDSDDDVESEAGLSSPNAKPEPPKSPGSILCSAKKARKNVK